MFCSGKQVEVEEHHESHVIPPQTVAPTQLGVDTQPEDLLLIAPGQNDEEREQAITQAVEEQAAAEQAAGAPPSIVQQAKSTAQRVLRGILHPAEGTVEGVPLCDVGSLVRHQ